ncbi:MAG: hypothetical protein JRD89_07905 [Deltaproteobacteria bacterium]|nr:hypothetical protein [Deltaproteobacteria bacterium]
MSVDAGDVFEFLAGVGKELGGLLPGGYGVAARIVSAAMTTAAALQSMGLDPEAEIVLMHSARPEVVRARARIEKLIKRKFHPPPPAGDGSDVYDEESDHGQS